MRTVLAFHLGKVKLRGDGKRWHVVNLNGAVPHPDCQKHIPHVKLIVKRGRNDITNEKYRLDGARRMVKLPQGDAVGGRFVQRQT